MMKRSDNKGFSLVELLTVIAIIAILAAVIFPVMTSVKENARRSQCMTNLHSISVGVQMFKVDNRRYPAVLGSEVYSTQTPPKRYVDNGTPPDMFENVKDKYLFAEYIKTIQGFHCPSAHNPNSRDVVIYDQTSVPNGDTENYSATLAVYAYDSYDCAVSGQGTSGGTFRYYNESSGNAERHYFPEWIPRSVTPDDTSVNAWFNSNRDLKPYPPGSTNDDIKIRMADYARQLRFRNPPGDTVVTWCSYHQGVDLGGKALVVFLDGHADSFPAKEMVQCKWRIRPKKT